MTVIIQRYFLQILQLSSHSECPDNCECPKSSKDIPALSVLSFHMGHKGSHDAILKIMDTAIFSYNMHYFAPRPVARSKAGRGAFLF